MRDDRIGRRRIFQAVIQGIVFVGVCTACCGEAWAQSVGTSISMDGAIPNTNAILDVQSPATGDGKGMLFPRVSQAQRISADASLPGGLLDGDGNLRGGAAQGLTVYQPDGQQGFYYNVSMGAAPSWVFLAPGDLMADGSIAMTGNLDLGGNTVSNARFIGDGSGITNLAAAETDPAFRSWLSTNIVSGVQQMVVGRTNILTGNVDLTEKLTTYDIKDNTLATEDLGNLAVTGAKISDNTIPARKMMSSGNLQISNEQFRVTGMHGRGWDLPSSAVHQYAVTWDDHSNRYVHTSIAGLGDMLRTVYDTNSNMRVDRADGLGPYPLAAMPTTTEHEKVLQFIWSGGSGYWTYKSLAELGGGDMLKSEYVFGTGRVATANSARGIWSLPIVNPGVGGGSTNIGKVPAISGSGAQIEWVSLAELGGGDMLSSEWTLGGLFRLSRFPQITGAYIGTNAVTDVKIQGPISSSKLDAGVIKTNTNLGGGLTGRLPDGAVVVRLRDAYVPLPTDQDHGKRLAWSTNENHWVLLDPGQTDTNSSDLYLRLSGGTMGGNIDMGGHSITNVANGSIVFQNGETLSAATVSNWNTAYGWGNHATAGYVSSNTWASSGSTTNYLPRTGGSMSGNLNMQGRMITNAAFYGNGAGLTNLNVTVTETDPVFTSWVATNALVKTESDPIFSASAASGISAGETNDWTTAYRWGNHAAAGYATGTPLYAYAETDPVWAAASNAVAVDVAARLASNVWASADSTTNFLARTGGAMSGDLDMGGRVVTNAAYYGDGAGLTNLNVTVTETDPVFTNWVATNTYVKTETDPSFSTSAANGISAGDTNNWTTAYGWGNHATAGYATGTPLYAYAETDPVWAAVSNAVATDIAARLESNAWTSADSTTNYLPRTGDLPMSGNLDMGGFSITNVAAGSIVFQSGETISSTSISNWTTAFGWGNHGTAGYATGTPLYVFAENDPLWTAASNAVTADVASRLESNAWALADSTTNYVPRTGGSMIGGLDLGGNSITNAQLVDAQFVGSIPVYHGTNIALISDVPAGSFSSYRPYTNEVAVSGTVTVHMSTASSIMIELTSPSTLDFVTDGTNGVTRNWVSLWCGTNTVTFNTNQIAGSEYFTLSTNSWNDFVIIKTRTNKWQGMQFFQ